MQWVYYVSATPDGSIFSITYVPIGLRANTKGWLARSFDVKLSLHCRMDSSVLGTVGV